MATTVTRALVRSQQRILKELQLHNGEIDGVWNGHWQEALNKWVATEGGTRTPTTPLSPPNRLPRGYVFARYGNQYVVVKEDAKENDGGERDLKKLVAILEKKGVVSKDLPQQSSNAATVTEAAIKQAESAKEQRTKAESKAPAAEKQESTSTDAQEPKQETADAAAPVEPKQETAEKAQTEAKKPEGGKNR